MYLMRAGPRSRMFFHPLEVRAAICTCGGICPGLNTVIRELVMCLRYTYGVNQVFGIRYGYEGLYSHDIMELTPDLVESIHHQGGTILGTSRGGFEKDLILASIKRNRFNHIYVIGGDGTHRGALSVYEAAVKAKMKLMVCCICKTIDNDLPYLDRTFGFETAVERAMDVVKCAHVEIKSCTNGVGLVKLFGRNSGFIAMNACLASREVNICLIPEVDFALDGPLGLLEHLRERLEGRNHALIVVAEGAGLKIMPPTGKVDKSGNPKIPDVGLFLRDRINAFFDSIGVEINMKYLDPAYTVRSVPPNASDSMYCAVVAQAAVHGAMAGYTGFSVGSVNNSEVYLPISKMTKSRQVDVMSRQWQTVLVSTGQTDFRAEKK